MKRAAEEKNCIHHGGPRVDPTCSRLPLRLSPIIAIVSRGRVFVSRVDDTLLLLTTFQPSLFNLTLTVLAI